MWYRITEVLGVFWRRLGYALFGSGCCCQTMSEITCRHIVPAVNNNLFKVNPFMRHIRERKTKQDFWK